MNLVPATVQKPMTQLRDQIQNLIERWAPQVWNREKEAVEWNAPLYTTTLGPAITLREYDKEIVVEAALPGLEKDEFHVDVSQNRLFIRTEKKQRHERKTKNGYQVMSSFGSFQRVLPLPREVNSERADAEYKNGILTVRLPKAKITQSRQIPIQVN
jgi:HSP20 family protein